jgi:hypothetical protein
VNRQQRRQQERNDRREAIKVKHRQEQRAQRFVPKTQMRAAKSKIPAPPPGHPTWHYCWIDGEWVHHEKEIITAIEEMAAAQAEAQAEAEEVTDGED